MIGGRVGVLALAAAFAAVPGGTVATAKPKPGQDRQFEYDWRTGVPVAPGAWTWTAKHQDQKEKAIAEAAATQARTCSKFSFLQWPVQGAEADAIRAETRRRYEAQGYMIEEKPAAEAGRTLWIVANAEREAVVLWGTEAGAPVYLSCITAGKPAKNADLPVIIGTLLALGLGALGVGLWLVRRVYSLGRASLGWSSTAGTIKTNEIRSYRVRRGHQFQDMVTYNYTVNGRPYVGDRIRFGAYAAELKAAEADAAKYPPGASVQVRYDPRDPSVSTLEPGTKGHSVGGIVLAVMGAIFVGLAALLAVID